MDDSMTVGVVVLCAKNEELSQLKTVFDKTFSSRPSRHSAYDQYTISPSDTKEPTELLLLGDCDDMGSTYSAARTGFVIGTRRPNLIIFVGTAGSLDSNKLKIGDVFIPNSCHSTYYDKLSERGTPEYNNKSDISGFQEYFFPALLDNECGEHQNLLSGREKTNSLTAIARRQIRKALSVQSKNVLEKSLKSFEDTQPPKIEMDGVIFSSDWLVNSSSFKDFLGARGDRKAIAVDMESFGFLETVDMFRGTESMVTNGIVVRGISDAATTKDASFDEGSAGIAMHNAATVAVAIIEKGYLA